ncbi:hypothetical protein GCM10010145_62600 [Streptomyces ruber]|uniref:Secreted protein n=2 Tax=Streptomyces TaxID=1883 RepID=A0A918BQQ2_9ACTN|nr:DUF6344 domain-containing protein [Streptomyces ruber]GGQ84537.1 hypothetical protein GCM10010145_62600 [Streptomyces ruber]
MARNKVMRLWTALVTAFLSLCTALGLITTTASAAVPQAESTCNSAPAETVPATISRPPSRGGSLPPTMKQRIRAEAHGSSPSCRHRPTTVTAAATSDVTDRTEATPSAPAPVFRE